MGETAEALVARLSADLSQFTREVQRGSRVAEEFGRETSQAFERADQSSRRIDQSVGGLLTTFRQFAPLVAGIGIGASFQSALRDIQQFEREFNNVRTLVDESTVSTSNLRQELLALPPILGSSQQLAAGLYQTLSAGIAPAQSVRFVGEAALFAQAALVQTNLAVDVGTTVLNAYGLAADQAGRVFDVLFETVRRGKTTGEELSRSLGPIIPIANTLGIQIEEVAAALATLTAGGIRTDQAATGLRSAFIQLIQNAEKLRDAGIDVSGVLSQRGLSGILDELRRATNGSSEALRELIPDSEGFIAVLSLANVQAERYAENLKVIGNSSGSVAVGAAKQAEGLAAAYTELGNTWDRILQQGAPIAGLFEAIVRSATDVLSVFQRQSPEDRIRALNDEVKALEQQLNSVPDNFFERIFQTPPESIQRRIQSLREEIGKLNEAQEVIASVDEFASELTARAQAPDEFAKALEAQRIAAARAAEDAKRQADEIAKKNEEKNKKIRREEESTTRFIDRILEQAAQREERRIQDLEARRDEIRQRRVEAEARAAERIHQTNLRFLEFEINQRQRLEQEAVEDRIRDFEELQQLARDIPPIPVEEFNEQFGPQVQSFEDLLKNAFERAGDNFQDLTADVIQDGLRGNLDDLSDFASAAEDIFTALPAQIAAAFARAELAQLLKSQLGDINLGRAGLGVSAGIGGGFLLSQLLGQAGVGGAGGGILSGLAAGAGGGAIIGSAVPGIGTGIGAAIGAGVGGLGGFISSIFGGGGPDTQRIALNTSQQVVEAAQKTALGFVQLLGEGSERVDAGQITNTIAELDRTIALSLSERQKQLASAALANPVNATVLGAGSEGTDDALAQVVAQRLKIIVAGIGGSAVAENVVGQVAGLESSELQAVQQRVNDAIAILRQIEEIETGPRTDTGRRIAAIEQQYADAIARAEEFGIATIALEQERERQIQEIRDNAQFSVTQRTLAITDPDEAARQALADRQRRERDELLAAGVSVAEIDALFVLEREQLARDLEAANVNVEAANDGIRRNAELLLLSLTDPFAEAQARIADQIDELRQQLDEGIISPDLFNQLEAQIQLAGQANEALRIIGGGPSGPVDQVARAFGGFIAAGNPLSASGQALFNLTEQFKLLAEATEFLGGSTEALEESYLAQAKVIRDELIAEIDRELDARRREIESIDDLIASFRVDASLPGNLRLGAAESQFQQALAGGNIQDIIAAANQLREIAQAQFGFSEGFFDIQREIEAGLSGARDSAQAAIEQERSDRIAAADREQQMILNGTQQIDIMNTLVNSFDRSGLFLEELVALQTEQRTENARIRGILEELLARQRN